MRQALFHLFVSIMLVVRIAHILKEGVAVRRYRRRNRRRRRGIKKKWIFIFILFIALCCFFSFKLRPMIQSITATVAKQAITLSIEEAIKEKISAQDIEYNDFVTIERDSSGNRLGITTNMVNMNQFKSEITTTIQEKLINNSSRTSVPIGTLIGGNLLRGYGPGVPLKIGLIGNVDINFKSSFESAGINQTIHKIYLTIHASCYSYLPGMKSESDVDTTVVVAETVIVGEVPSTYANFQLPNLTASNGNANQTTASQQAS